MEECLKKVYNKKTQKDIETQYETGRKTLKAYVDANKNSKISLVKNLARRFKKMLKRMTLKKRMKKGEEDYRQVFCNPECKATLFEAGEPDYLSPALVKVLKKELKDFQLDFNLADWVEIRKQLFGKDKNVLKDGFYKGIGQKTVKTLRNRGALSGCYQENVAGLRLAAPLL